MSVQSEYHAFHLKIVSSTFFLEAKTMSFKVTVDHVLMVGKLLKYFDDVGPELIRLVSLDPEAGSVADEF